MHLPFSPKLRLAALWPAATALLVVAVLLYLQLPGILATAAARDLDDTARLAERALELPEAATGVPDPDLQGAAQRWVRGTSLRLTVIESGGRVVADSARAADQVAAMEDHSDRPEVRAALARGQGSDVRESDTTGLETAYAARLVTTPGGTPWIVRVALPLSSVGSVRRHLSRALLLSALLAALLIALLSWWLGRQLFRPLAALIAAADAFGRGDYRHPVPAPGAPELATLGRALERIAAEARRQIDAVESERDLLRSTVAGMAEGVLMADRAGRVRLVNPAFRALFALPASAAPAEVLDLAREPRLTDLLSRAQAGSETRVEQIERLEPQRRILALAATRLAGHQGVVLVARDVTESERLDEMRRDFVANVSHELRTPLAAIQGYAETLVDGAVEERETARRFSERILDQCRRLGELLADLLTLSRLEGAGALRAPEPVDLAEMVAEALEPFAARAAAKRIRIEVEPGPPPIVRGDADGLLRLISNLIDNALKYNREGGRVAIRTSAEGEQAALEVADTGIGIPAAALPRIFERFYRVDKGRAREEGGTGLGLAIVKHVAQAHGGRVEVESELGRGTTFRVWLPLHEARAAPPPG